jgi:dihydrofolate reductase
MAKLIYSALMSLDGYIEDENGNFDWAEPDEESHGFINDLERGIGTYLLGRRMYEVMVAWETIADDDTQPQVMRDFARGWRSADKIVYSSTLDAVSSERTRLEREFDPEAVRRLKESAERDISISGPDLASTAAKAGLVDEVHVFIAPVVVGGGKTGLPQGTFAKLELIEERRFTSGTVYLRDRTI